MLALIMIPPSTIDIAFAALFFFLGLIFGSFGNVLAIRLMTGESIRGRSHCVHCGKILHPLELIPLFSFLWLTGRCSNCKKRLSLQYPFVEFMSALIFLFAYSMAETISLAVVLALALWLLFLVSVTDAKTGGIPDALSLPFVVLGFVYSFFTDSLTLLGPLIGAGFFALQWIASRGKWLGSGDIILGLGIGALLGSWQQTLFALWCAYVLGAFIASILLILKLRTVKQSLPFAPFLAFGTIMAIAVNDVTTLFMPFLI